MAGLDDLMGGGDGLGAGSLGGSIGGGTNKEIMAAARAALTGNWGVGILGYVLYFVLMMCFSVFVCAAVFFVTAVGAMSGSDMGLAGVLMQLVSSGVELLVSGAFMVGFCGFFLGIAQEEQARLELLFVGFQRFWKSFAVYFFYMVFVYLWTLLFVIPGIIAMFRYAMAFFIVADDENCGPLEAITRSKEMMKGNKWKFFCLHWRFVGWWILATFFTFGIGYLWLVPYMQTSFAKFYEDVK